MLRYLEAIEELPVDIKGPLLKVLDLFREEVAETVKKSDFEELKAVVTRLAHSQDELAEAQKRTEGRASSLEAAVERLAEAQKRTEEETRGLTKEFKRV